MSRGISTFFPGPLPGMVSFCWSDGPVDVLTNRLEVSELVLAYFYKSPEEPIILLEGNCDLVGIAYCRDCPGGLARYCTLLLGFDAEQAPDCNATISR